MRLDLVGDVTTGEHSLRLRRTRHVLYPPRPVTRRRVSIDCLNVPVGGAGELRPHGPVIERLCGCWQPDVVVTQRSRAQRCPISPTANNGRDPRRGPSAAVPSGIDGRGILTHCPARGEHRASSRVPAGDGRRVACLVLVVAGSRSVAPLEGRRSEGGGRSQSLTVRRPPLCGAARSAHAAVATRRGSQSRTLRPWPDEDDNGPSTISAGT